MKACSRIVVATDQPIIVWGIRAALATTEDIMVVAEVSITAGIKEVCHTYQTCLLVLDADMSLLSLHDVITHVKRDCPAVAVVVLSTATDAATIRIARRAGAAAYLLKTDSLDQVATTLRAIAHGATWHARQTLRKLIIAAADPYKEWGLTPREVDVLHALAQGLSNKKIADRLHISVYTVRNCTGGIYAKLGVTTRTAAAMWVLAHHINDHPPTHDTDI